MTGDDHLAHLAHVPIDAARLARWRDGAARLGEAASALRGELDELVRDRTRHRLSRAAKAARWIESMLTGEAALIANAIATELENDAG